MSSHLPLSASSEQKLLMILSALTQLLSLCLSDFKSWVPPPSALSLSLPYTLSFLHHHLFLSHTLILCLRFLFRHLPQQHYGPLGPPVSTSALAVRGQHPPVVGGLPTRAGSPVQRPALPTGHGGGGVDAHAPPVRLREDQVQWNIYVLHTRINFYAALCTQPA